MSKVLTFRIEVKGVEDKIYRDIEIIDNNTLADLAYITLSSFELLFCETFIIKHKNNQYDSVLPVYDNDLYKSAISISLKDLELDQEQLIMDYINEEKITFVINYTGSKKITSSKDNYPTIVGGNGKGVPDFISTAKLKNIVEETDRLGYSNYSVTIEIDGVEEEETFDYRDFDIKENSFVAKVNFNFLKEDYEKNTLSDILRIIKERQHFFVKTDTWKIVNPYDYIKKYIPKNYSKLTYEEQKKLNIPDYEDLNIYMLPTYEKINHKEIMTLYVKRNITDKEIRQALFYSLRNYDYMDKFYNNLRKYGLFKSYLNYSDYYYEEIINEWMTKNKIKR